MGASGPGRVLAAPGGCHGYPSPGQQDALPTRCRFLPSIPRELGYPGWGSHIPPHSPGTPSVAWACSPRCAPRASLGQELSSPSTERGRIQRLRCPKSPQSLPSCLVLAARCPRPGGQPAPPPLLAGHSPCAAPPKPPSPCSGVQRFRRGLPRLVAAQLWNKRRAPGSSRLPQRHLSAPPGHKKRREIWKMDARSTPSPAALPQDTKAPLRTDFTPLLP